MLIEFAQLSPAQTYVTMTQSVLPRPIAWVLSENANATYNLAPFSYFTAVCSDPPLLMFSIGVQADGRFKDTLMNVMHRPEFVVHIADGPQLAALNRSAATRPAGDSEVTAGQLETVAVAGCRLPRLAACKVAFMCRVHKIDTLGHNYQHLVFGDIAKLYLADDCTTTDSKGRMQILADKINPLARLGANQYATLGEIVFASRPE